MMHGPINIRFARHASAFFGSACIVRHESVPGGTTVSAAACVEVLSHLQHKVRRKRPEKLHIGWILHC